MVLTLNNERRLNDRFWRAVETSKHAELYSGVKEHFADFDEVLAQAQAARKQAGEGFIHTLDNPTDKKILRAFEDNWLSGFSDSKKQALAEELGMNFEAITVRYGELLGMRKPLQKQAHTASATFLEKVLEAKKKLYATPEGKLLIMDTMNTQLADHNQRWGGWFSGALKDADSIEKIALCHPASWDSVVQALQGGGDNHSLITLVRQAEEIAHFEGKSVSEILPERLKMVGLSDFQVDFFTKTVKAYEAGTHEAFFDGLWKEHETGVKALREEQLACFRQGMDEAARARAATEGAEAGAKAAGGATEAAEDAARATKNAAKEESWVSKLGTSITEKPGRAAAIAAGAAVVIGGGAWALGEMNKKAEAEAKPKQL